MPSAVPLGPSVFLNWSDDVQWTLQGAMSEPISSVIQPNALLEDTGLPNFEGRIALGYGTLEQIGLMTQRPFEMGLSTVVGKLRTTAIDGLGRRVNADVWGAATDYRVNLTSYFGFAGEVYTGQGLGTYKGGILQSVDDVTWQAVRSHGGWLEGFVYLSPCLHSHNGVGIDDPDDNDITGVADTILGRTYNRTIYSNLIWDVNRSVRIGSEVAYRETDYKLPTTLDNDGWGFHTQLQMAF